MKKVVKLNKRQLRGLISEAIQAKQWGAPEPYAVQAAPAVEQPASEDWRVSEARRDVSMFIEGMISELGLETTKKLVKEALGDD